ncbi:MAG: AI-2E family transporter [Erysipelotrichaceae bacterium]
MKYRFDEQMKKNVMTYGIVAIIAVLTYFIFFNYPIVKNYLSGLFTLLFPFILGCAVAFLLNQPMIYVEKKLKAKTKLKDQTIRKISAISALIFGIAIVSLFLMLLIPQLVTSVKSLVNEFPSYLKQFESFVDEMIIKYELDANIINSLFGTQQEITTKITNFFSGLVPQVVNVSYQMMKSLFNVLLGIVAGLYLMLDKEKFFRFAKKVNYAFFPKNAADYIRILTLRTNDIFNNFIIGKAIDSLIIGILCYVGMSILQLPYALLLSVIVGCTNMIPVFGPFIGAVPGIFILMIIKPIDALWFSLFILVLQQFDGNILGPLILGDKLGIPSLCILFSVVVGGGLFGVVGMFIGVPTFAIIYSAIKEYLDYRLKKMEVVDIDKT